MKRNWSDDELAEQWSLSPEELALLPDRVGHNRFGFAVQLKFFEIEGRFPRSPRDVPAAALRYLASQLGLSINIFQKYDWRGRARKDHRAAIRGYLGFRAFTAADGARLDDWLRHEVVPFDQNAQSLTEAVLGRCRNLRIEPPSPKRIERRIRSLLHRQEAELFATIAGKLPSETCVRLDALLQPTGSTETATGGYGEEEHAVATSLFSQLKTDPGPVGLNSVLKELAKLEQLTVVGLPADVLGGIPSKLVHKYRLRAATEPPREMRLHSEPVRYTLMAAFCWQRRREVIDGLVELLIRIVHRIGARAEKKIVKELLGDLQRVHGKTTLLFKMAEVALSNPDGTIKEVLYPIVSEKTLGKLVQEYRSQGPAYRQHVHTLIRSSYSHHYRRMLPLILQALRFRSNNSAHQPVIDALAWLQAHRDDRCQFVACEDVPIDGVIGAQMQDLLLEEGPDGTERINRINYEIAVLQALREQLRCKEIWVEGAERYRNPDDDLPADFDHRRAAYYDALELSQDPDVFVASVQHAMSEALAEFDQGLPRNPKVKLRPYGKNRIALSPSDPQPEPDQLGRLKAEVLRRWPMTSLLDVLKETDLRIGFTDAFQTLASREILDRDTLRPRLLRCLYGLGTNAGLKRMMSTDAGINYTELLYARRRFIQKDALREAIRCVINATLSARLPEIWGEATTTCASDSKHYGAWDQNLMTEWHARYHKAGIMVYWHTDLRAACIYSQLKRCPSSEVAAMIEGVLRHCTEMTVERQYVDSHGQSDVAFGLTHLLGFELMPRLKAIASQKLYRPEAGRPEDYPNLQPILTRPINWDLIRQQYDEMVKYATALRLGTADSEVILKRFMRSNRKHPTYQALIELGKAKRTIFLCRYLNSETIRQEVNAGLNVVENWNSANDFIFYGKSGEIATNRLDDQEIAILSLHLLQACLVYVNTLMIQQVLGEPHWLERMSAEDRRALTPLIYLHINPYGIFELDMDKRIPIDSSYRFLAA